jgi:phosphatidylserine decarboxylase
MQHCGKAAKAGRKMLLRTLAGAIVLAAIVASVGQWACGHGLDSFLAVMGLWAAFAVFCIAFFRDPDSAPNPPANAYLAPAHGVVDIIDETNEAEFIGGPCRRISIFLSVFDVHVQKSPVAGTVSYMRHHQGEFLNALNLDSAARNENVMLGFTPAANPQEKVGVRLIAGLIARRIIPWSKSGDPIAHGERISLIQFGSRVTLYLPLDANVQVALKQRVQGGITVLATRPTP